MCLDSPESLAGIFLTFELLTERCESASTKEETRHTALVQLYEAFKNRTKTSSLMEMMVSFVVNRGLLEHLDNGGSVLTAL